MRSHAKASVVVVALFAFLAFASSALASYGRTGTFAGPGIGSGDGELDTPGRAAVEQSSGNLFVVDSGNARVQVFAPNGSGEADYLTQFGGGELSEPWGIAIDENAGQTFVYVSSAGSEEIVKYASDEAATPSFSVDGSFSSPLKGEDPSEVGAFKAALAIDPTTHDLLVADNANKRIARFEADGTPDGSFDGSNGATAFAGPIDLAVNSSDDVYVIDANGPNIAKQEGISQVLRYSGAGEYKATLGPVGTHERPATVAINPDNDEVAVSGDQDNVYEAGPPPFVPVIQLFDSADNPLPSPSFPNNEAEYDSVGGLAIAAGSSDRLYVVLDVGYYNSETFGSPQIHAFQQQIAPEATIDPVDPGSVSATEATFSGTVDPNGKATAYRFEYSRDAGAHWASTPTQSAGSGVAPVPVTAELEALVPSSSYEVRLLATNEDGEASAGPVSFETPTAAPVLTTLPASRVGPDSAWLRGRINPGGLATTYHFEYGTSTAYGASLPASEDGSAGDGSSAVAVSQILTNLQPNTTYHYRLIATNSKGTAEGADVSFTTGAPVGSCANEAIRIEQGSQSLPECRAYEKVTPLENGNADVYPVFGLTLASESGDRIAFVSGGGMPGSKGVQYETYYLSSRNADGWSTANNTPTLEPFGAATFMKPALFPAYSADLSKAVVGAVNPPLTPDAPRDVFNLYLRDNIANTYRLISSSVPSVGYLKELANFGSFAAASDDFSHIAFESFKALTPDAPDDSLAKVYEWHDGTIRLVGKLGNGEAAPGGSAAGFGARQGRVASAMSADGERIIFTSPGGLNVSGDVYLREGGSSTDQVNASERSTPDPGGPQPATYRGASSDGSRVFFITAEQLLDVDTNDKADLYMYLQGPDPEAESNLTLISKDDDPISTAGGAMGLLGNSEDGEYVYFAHQDTLLPGLPQLDSGGVYAWHDGEVRFIGALGISLGDFQNLSPTTGQPLRSRVSANGRFLAFTSVAPITGYDSTGPSCPAFVASDDPQCHEVFHYDYSSDEVTCVSCPPEGGAPVSNAEIVYVKGTAAFAPGPLITRPLLEDGRVFFDTAEALVGDDVNGRRDVYMFKQGDVSLVSSGRGNDDADLADVSADGDSVFFTTAGQLLAGDRDTVADMYVARVGGGFPEPAAESPPCSPEDCQGPPAAPPQAQRPASTLGAAPARGKPRRPRCKERPRKSAKKSRARCAKQRANKKNNAAKQGGNR